jgi:hypothetical protein
MKDPPRPIERNVGVFNADTATHGGYVYTACDSWSSRYASRRQTEELILMLAEHVPRSVQAVDIGCGDGTSTMDIAERFGPLTVRGIDPAENAISCSAGTHSFTLRRRGLVRSGEYI